MATPKLNFDAVTEYIDLLWINLKCQANNFIDFIRVATRYYSNPLFRKEDKTLLLTYLLNSPFAISKEFLKEHGHKDLYAYGETPLTTMELISKEAQINAKDVVFELGFGRGRTCFWLNAFIGCKVVGIEQIPLFVSRANEIKSKYSVEGVEFRQQDMLTADFSGATVIYLYGTCLEDTAIAQLIQQFKKLPSSTKIITISYPLTDYTEEPIFEVMKRFPARYPWGLADVYLQLRK